MLQAHSLRALLLASCLGLTLCACGGGGAASTSASTGNTANTPTVAAASINGVSQSNAQIAALIYSDSQRTPSGFYTESVPVFNGYVATSHLKTQSINPSATLQYELCTDDYNQALTWSNTADTVSGDNASLTGTDITDHYFEFDRLRSGTPNGYLRERVYKCAYLNRNTLNVTGAGGDAGTFNQRPLDAASLKQLAEYLWTFTTYNNYGNVVLSSSGSSTNGLSHSLTMATLTHAATSGACDTINLIEWKHSVDNSTGELTLSINSLGSFQASESNGNVSLCSS